MIMSNRCQLLQLPKYLVSKRISQNHIFCTRAFSSSFLRRNEDNSHKVDLDALNKRYGDFFSEVDDPFELQRGLNNCFAYDLLPSSDVLESALRAARRLNDFAVAVRILEGIKVKCNAQQYKKYLHVLQPVLTELSIPTKEKLFSN
ncbi:cytochrome c oxidase subunit VI [Schizosaccharomyces japonicus yFS275]|uniref:Cytochrome c oxidase subunit 6, mitochondrial n=1 Tax=Schizosaccharomyces japonicus (strain yFS275 / FY16936) TaxID=402676 RepID=B6K0G2_SCHJY|nr:cytochrome c oxidase subunit VI [Schizosaccharomyces japonicus yFS275]EEB06312.2 cytochrome c oxidase subunit VI [Schizosaccharomyces japonicus yFS275]